MNNESYKIQQSGNIGQEIISSQGKVIAWTTDPVIGALLISILNKYDLETIFDSGDTQKEETDQ